MKKTLYNFTKSFIKIIATFVVTFYTAVISSNNTNSLYDFLNRHGYSDPTIQKVILSSLIVAAVGVLQLVFGLLYKTLLWIIKRYFKRLTVDIKFKINNRNKELIKFKPVSGEYEEEKVDIELEIVPAGKISMFILKLLGLQIEIFFNPHIIDVTLVNDQEWLNENAGTRLNEKQAICISVLKNYRLGGLSMKSFIMTESIFILPKRVKRDTAHIDFKLTSVIGSKISSALCDSNMKELNIECEGGK
ncbi:hypothetical protein [Bacillus altitudinis]|uniref:hypothetical protein n=1 Tax=Bacillus altitudinis TaxID=293387 RepID=UPI001931FC76|nr:hypothetical protein [Bacillus altitudinis]MEC1184493.1 hypothetical protein [Bacillus altitudinis]QRF83712.1 hypothetical protein JNE42_00920 [Bacillus altitudinis]UNG01375.1 hypothetical protein MMZ59_00920 [Bacillus altitudinis]BDC57193.1 hypothetical protein NC3_01530 [Bacillus altitudinis]